MFIVCFDLEGVFTPEVWIQVAESTGIPELRLTTRDISDYDVLMQKRIKILRDNQISLTDIQNVIQKMDLLPGAKEFLDWLRARAQVIILSDTFIEFAMPFMKKLGNPTLLCHNLTVDDKNFILDYNLRIDDQKRRSVLALKQLNFQVVAAGDSYNDTAMLQEANHGILFRPPQNVIDEFPQFPVATSYIEMKNLIQNWLKI